MLGITVALSLLAWGPVGAKKPTYTPYLNYVSVGYTPFPRENKLPEVDNAYAVFEDLPASVTFKG